ncbi:MAG: hypothetical protein WDA22_12905 [Bacteroidota bacterium]
MHSIWIQTNIASSIKISLLIRMNDMFHPKQINIEGSNAVSGKKYGRTEYA